MAVDEPSENKKAMKTSYPTKGDGESRKKITKSTFEPFER